MKKLIALAAAFALVASTAQAQTVSVATNPGSVTTYATVIVPTLLKLTIDDTSSTIPAPSVTDFDAGFQDAGNLLNATVKSNKAWTLSIKGGAATWTGTGGASATKAVTDLHWSTSGPGAGTALTTSNVTLASGAGGTTGGASGQTFAIDYRVLWSYTNDTPGTYSIPVIFTAAAP